MLTTKILGRFVAHLEDTGALRDGGVSGAVVGVSPLEEDGSGNDGSWNKSVPRRYNNV